jgi:hypothetical protein
LREVTEVPGASASLGWLAPKLELFELQRTPTCPRSALQLRTPGANDSLEPVGMAEGVWVVVAVELEREDRDHVFGELGIQPPSPGWKGLSLSQ